MAVHSASPKCARIGVFLPRLSDYGGVERFAWRLARTLADDGHDVEFVCSRVESDPPPGVSPVVVGRAPFSKALKVAWYAYAAERVRRRKGYDLTIGMGEMLGMDILRVSGGPHKYFWPLSARAYPKGLPRAWKTLRRLLSPASWVSKWIQDRQAASDSRIVTVSHLSRDWLIGAYPHLRAEDIRVIYNRPDLDRFHPPSCEEREAARKRFGMEDGETAVAFAGTAFERKGLLPTIAAMAQLPESFKIYVAGGRNPGAFGREARRQGVADRVVFMGKVTDIPTFYHACDLAVVPTFFDTCANVTVESIASGLRTVGSSSDGSSYFLPPEWVIQNPEDPAEIAARLRAAAAHTEPVAFTWPEDVPSGLEAYVPWVRELIAEKMR